MIFGNFGGLQIRKVFFVVWKDFFVVFLYSSLVSLGFRWFPSTSVGFVLFLWFSWISMDFQWFPLIFINFPWFPSIFFVFHWFPMVSFDPRRFPLVFISFPWFSFIFVRFPWFSSISLVFRRFYLHIEDKVWKSTEIEGTQLKPKKIDGRQWNSMKCSWHQSGYKETQGRQR